LYRESVNGAALLAYDKETLRDDFKLKLGPITTILKAVREYKTSEFSSYKSMPYVLMLVRLLSMAVVISHQRCIL